MSSLSSQPCRLATFYFHKLRARPWLRAVQVVFLLPLLFAVAESRAQTVDPAPPTEEPRIYADSFLVWIYAKPQRDPAPIGYLRGGQSVALRSHEGNPVQQRVRKGCGKGWYAVEPAGFVCLDRHASLSPTRYSKNMAMLAPREGAYPFEYVLSMGSPSYRRVPTTPEWQGKERVFGRARTIPLPPHWKGHEELITYEDVPLESAPNYLISEGSISRRKEQRLVRRNVPFGSMLAVTSAFKDSGRSYLQSADGTLVPAERFRLFKQSRFAGVELSQTKRRLPLAWPRKRTRSFSLKNSSECSGSQRPTGQEKQEKSSTTRGKLKVHPLALNQDCLITNQQWHEPRIPLELSGAVVIIGGTQLLQTATGTWLPRSYLFVAEEKVPPAKLRAGTHKKWLHFRIREGTLVSYFNGAPVFATLASPGIGGTPQPGQSPLQSRTTPLGTYRIQFKHRTDDMSPEQTEHRKFWIADVPYAMYFQQPFAIHVAYWHESFGEPMSGGCINVSPLDGARLFAFTEPHIPKNWYGVGASKAFGPGTTITITR